MISEKFKEEVKSRINSGDILFYNSAGNPEAYKLFVRHLSSSPFLSQSFKIGNKIHPNDFLYLVDFENELIIEVDIPIELIDLKEIN